MQSSGKQLWVGITDRETEGVYKYLNGQTVNQNEPLLYKLNFPGGGRGENCLHFIQDVSRLNDAPCNYVTTSWGGNWHGFCEIKNPTF